MTRLGGRGIVVSLCVLGFVVPAGASYALWSATATATLGVSTAAPVAPSCTSGSSTVTAVADAWISQKSPSQNKGDDSALYVESKSGSSNVRTLVRFALPSIPSTCAVTGATLNLYNSAPATGRTIDVRRAGATWTESTVTWNTFSGPGKGPQGTAVGSATTGSPGSQSWTVTALVQDQYVGPNHGFVLLDRTEDTGSGPVQTYRSRETGSTPPALTISWS